MGRIKGDDPGCMVVIPFTDAFGETRPIEVTAAVAEVLLAEEPRLAEHLLLKPDGIEKVAEVERSGGFWDGPRMRFRLLLGESWTWDGGLANWEAIQSEASGLWAWRCRFCRGKKLPSYAYCLNCDRCGRELEIPGAVEAERERRRARRAVRDDVKGGLKGKR